jgi:hypothetical protein
MLVELGIELQQLLVAAENGAELTARTARDLTKAARVGVILGQPEGIWLDAKREPYPTSTELQRWEIAKDVAAFANAGIDALILIGVATKATVNGDVLDSTHAFPIAKMDPVAVRAIVRDRVTPDIQHLDVGVVESRGGYGYGWIFVPAQPQGGPAVHRRGCLAGWRRTRQPYVHPDPQRGGHDVLRSVGRPLAAGGWPRDS